MKPEKSSEKLGKRFTAIQKALKCSDEKLTKLKEIFKARATAAKAAPNDDAKKVIRAKFRTDVIALFDEESLKKIREINKKFRKEKPKK